MSGFQVNDARDAITREVGDVAALSSHVMRERETVTDLVTEVNMMVTKAVRLVWSVAVITVSSSELTIMKKMTAVRSRLIHHNIQTH